MIKYEYFKDSKLLITKYIGEINKESIKSYIDYIVNKSDCDELENLISDYRDSNLLFNSKDLKDIAQIRNVIEIDRIPNQTVFLVDTPRETALVLLISNMHNKNLKPSYCCSTLKRCIQILSLDIKDHELRRRLKELKFEFTDYSDCG